MTLTCASPNGTFARSTRRCPIVLQVLALLISLSLSFAGAPAVTYAGGDGSSFEKAILIKNATEETGVNAEYAYIKKHFPGYGVGQQMLMNHEGRVYDVLEIGTKKENRKIYFDITEFFGKF